MSAPRSKSTKELLKSARLPERSVSICVRGDIVADIEELNRQLGEAVSEGRANGRLSSKSPAKRVAEKIEALQDEMRDATITLRLRARKRHEWREWELANPPRDNVPEDEKVGFDFDAWVEHGIKWCAIDHDLDDEDWENLLENAAPQDLLNAALVAYSLHGQGVSVPKSQLASLIVQRKDDGSN